MHTDESGREGGSVMKTMGLVHVCNAYYNVCRMACYLSFTVQFEQWKFSTSAYAVGCSREHQHQCDQTRFE